MKALVGKCSDFQTVTRKLSFDVAYHDDGTGQVVEYYNFDVMYSESVTPESIRTAILTEVLSHATSQSYSMAASDVVILVPNTLPQGFKDTPLAAIANAPADATTTYNVVTTLLGSLTGAVNTANAKQNDIATKLNSVIAALRTVGIIVT